MYNKPTRAILRCTKKPRQTDLDLDLIYWIDRNELTSNAIYSDIMVTEKQPSPPLTQNNIQICRSSFVGRHNNNQNKTKIKARAEKQTPNRLARAEIDEKSEK